jgi:phosphatidylinositol glycan class B
VRTTCYASEMTATLSRSLLLIAAVTLVTAWFSDLFYFPDEHYQVLEFMSYRLGTTGLADMPWEFFARIRPWMQPFLYYLIARPLLLVGVKDLFTITFLLRLATGALSLAALALFAREILPTIKGEEEERAFAGYLPLFGFLPYLFVRTSSETMSAAFFTLSLALMLRPQTAMRFLIAGAFSGLAFECRFQSAFLTAGLLAWLLIMARVPVTRLALFLLGMAGAVAAGALVDHWGYGVWCFPPWDYFHVNILQGVAAKTYGADPVLAYFWMLPAQFFAPITIVLMIAMIVMWLRNPRHVLTWVTLPFFLIHMAVGHKEARFMFPLVILATAFPVLAFSPRLPRWRNMAQRVWGWRRGVAAKFTAAVSILGMAILAIYPFGIRPHMPMAQYLYRHFPAGLSAYSFDAQPFDSYPMYRPHPFAVTKLKDEAALATLLQKGPVYIMSDTPTLPGDLHGTLLYSEFPFAAWGYAEAGTNTLHGFEDFRKTYRWLKMPRLAWVTLYRLDATR